MANATFLDVTGLQHFTSIFVFLFVWVVGYAMLSWTKALGGNKFIDAVLSMLMAIFVLLSDLATGVIADIAPFIAVVFMFLVMTMVASRMLGGDMESMTSLKGVFIVFIVLIILVSAAFKVKQNIDMKAETDQALSENLRLVLNPTFMGTVLILSIAVFTIALLASKSA